MSQDCFADHTSDELLLLDQADVHTPFSSSSQEQHTRPQPRGASSCSSNSSSSSSNSTGISLKAVEQSPTPAATPTAPAISKISSDDLTEIQEKLDSVPINANLRRQLHRLLEQPDPILRLSNVELLIKDQLRTGLMHLVVKGKCSCGSFDSHGNCVHEILAWACNCVHFGDQSFPARRSGSEMLEGLSQTIQTPGKKGQAEEKDGIIHDFLPNDFDLSHVLQTKSKRRINSGRSKKSVGTEEQMRGSKSKTTLKRKYRSTTTPPQQMDLAPQPLFGPSASPFPMPGPMMMPPWYFPYYQVSTPLICPLTKDV